MGISHKFEACRGAHLFPVQVSVHEKAIGITRSCQLHHDMKHPESVRRARPCNGIVVSMTVAGPKLDMPLVRRLALWERQGSEMLAQQLQSTRCPEFILSTLRTICRNQGMYAGAGPSYQPKPFAG